MTLVTIITRENITMMNVLRLKSRRKAPQLMLKSLKHPSLDCISSPEGWTEEGRMTRPYSLEWHSVPYPPKFKPPTLRDNDAIITRLFIGTLKGVTFDWSRSLPSGSINSWINLKTQFLSRFYEDDSEVSMDKLLSTVQKGGESARKYIERFRNLSHVPRRYAITHVTPNMPT